MRRRCTQLMPDGHACRAAPMRDSDQCFLHDPTHAKAAAEARRLGGIRRRREGTLELAYDLSGLDSADGLRRLLEIIVADSLGLENGIGRLRVLIAAVNAAGKLLEASEFEARLAALEVLEHGRRLAPQPVVAAKGLLDGDES